jgi:hypothetical protein
MSVTLFRCAGCEVTLPLRTLVLVDREDGGSLVVNPPREVWERCELSAAELTQWSFLVAATGAAMIETLPQLQGGCVNYWEAGNWALHEQAAPVGPKTAHDYRRVHLHLLGRSRSAKDPSWKWGEAPRFPDFADRHRWAGNFQRLNAEECVQIVVRLERLLNEKYGVDSSQMESWSPCTNCRYPTVLTRNPGRCAECAA